VKDDFGDQDKELGNRRTATAADACFLTTWSPQFQTCSHHYLHRYESLYVLSPSVHCGPLIILPSARYQNRQGRRSCTKRVRQVALRAMNRETIIAAKRVNRSLGKDRREADLIESWYRGSVRTFTDTTYGAIEGRSWKLGVACIQGDVLFTGSKDPVGSYNQVSTTSDWLHIPTQLACNTGALLNTK
jgi:hypothetical protein